MTKRTNPSTTKRRPRADRNANTREVLAYLRAHGPSTQSAIARAKDLSRATVNQIVQTLRDQGAIEYQWKNRREALLTLASTRGSLATVMVHEHFAHAILFDFTAQQRFDFSSTESKKASDAQVTPATVLALLNRLAEFSASRSSPLSGVAIAIEGPIEQSTGAIAPWAWQRLPHWKRLDIAQHFHRQLRLPVVVDNDANLAALAEWTWGVGRGCDDFLHITCSAGIGGGLVINGKVYRGGTGLAGEIGHMVIEEAGDLCFCGSRGCLTSFATERAILRALGTARKSETTLTGVIASALQGDAACQRVISEAGQHLGKALATVVRVIGPSVIAIGGTLGKAGEVVMEGLRSSAEVINLRSIGKAPEFRIASIIDHAPEIGGLAAILSEIDHGVSELVPWMLTPRAPADASA